MHKDAFLNNIQSLNFACCWNFMQWNHLVCVPLCLPSLASYHVFKIHSCTYLWFIYFHCCVVPHTYYLHAYSIILLLFHAYSIPYIFFYIIPYYDCNTTVFTVSGHLDHFHIGTIINNAAMSIDVVSWCICAQHSANYL